MAKKDEFTKMAERVIGTQRENFEGLLLWIKNADEVSKKLGEFLSHAKKELNKENLTNDIPTLKRIEGILMGYKKLEGKIDDKSVKFEIDKAVQYRKGTAIVGVKG